MRNIAYKKLSIRSSGYKSFYVKSGPSRQHDRSHLQALCVMETTFQQSATFQGPIHFSYSQKMLLTYTCNTVSPAEI